MITPFMHILSCINEKYEMDAPVDILYLGRRDRDLIISEAKRLGSIFSNESKIWIENAGQENEYVSEYQAVAGKAVTLNRYTALLLTRLLKCYRVYFKEFNIVVAEMLDEDLSEDAVILRLEGNPFFIYTYVFKVMRTASLNYDAKIAKLSELLMTIKAHSVVEQDGFYDSRLRSRLVLHSQLSFWKGMLMSDYIQIYGEVPESFTEDTIKVIRKELLDLGFYGFVNPLDMYWRFNSSRVTRKINVSVDDSVVDFLTKVVKSGGGTT